MEYKSLTEQDVHDFLEPDESAADLLTRLRHETLHTGLTFLDQHIALRPGSLLEISGPVGSGKTSILLRVACEVVLMALSQQADGAPGPRLQVVLIDMDGKMDPLHLVQVLQNQMTRRFPDSWNAYDWAQTRLEQHYHILGMQQQASGRPAPGMPLLSPEEAKALQKTVSDWDNMLQDCLSRIHVLRVVNSMELLAGLLTLAPRMKEWKETGNGCAVLLIDNVGAFTHADRANKGMGYRSGHLVRQMQQQQHQQHMSCNNDMVSSTMHVTHVTHPGSVVTQFGVTQAGQAPSPMHLYNSPPTAVPQLSFARVQTSLATVLQRLSQKLRLSIIATKTASVALTEPSASSPAKLVAKEFMTAAWCKHVTHRLSLTAPVQLRSPAGRTVKVAAQMTQGNGMDPSPLMDIHLGSLDVHYHT